MIDFEKILENVENKETIIQTLKAEIGKEFVARADFNAKNEELKTANSLLKEREEQLETLSELEGDKQTLKSEIEKLKTQNKETTDQYNQQLRDLRMDHAMNEKLRAVFKEDTIDYIKTKIPKENLTFTEDGKLVGLDEAIEPLKESQKSFLLDKTQNPTFIKSGGSGVSPTMTREDIEKITDAVERQKKIQENLHLFR